MTEAAGRACVAVGGGPASGRAASSSKDLWEWQAGRLASGRRIQSNAGLVSFAESSMAIRIKSRQGESTGQMLRRFKKLCEKEGLTKDIKRKQYFEKPSER
ncbi:MAG: 30S ribosomal protein S21, partial [Planctomycetota bacterium]